MIPNRLKYSGGKLYILDQRLLPYKVRYFKASDVYDVARSIKEMMVRGAPLIGDTAAFGYLIAMDNIIKNKLKDKNKLIKILKESGELLKSQRPTAVSLSKAIERVSKKIDPLLKSLPDKIGKNDLLNLRNKILEEVKEIVDEDINSTFKIAENGLCLLNKNSTIITYCNTGALATMGIGTALGIITRGYQKGKVKFVYAPETRPYLQGARLTAFELLKNNIPFKLICDNTTGWIMKTRKIDAVIIGADRIIANGDTANKIGSYSLAILARFHNIPFYVAAPTDTFDLSIKNSKGIKIEERDYREVIKINNKFITHPDVKAEHLAFDVVPHNLISAIITEKGIIKNPDPVKISLHLKK